MKLTVTNSDLEKRSSSKNISETKMLFKWQHGLLEHFFLTYF